MFEYLSTLTPGNERAWDCATGNGQTALALSRHFSEVVGTDASENQIRNAHEIEGVTFKVENAEKSSFTDNSVDLITVAQALHWFDIEAFSREVSRVLKNRGILAVWTYGLLEITPEINEVINHLYGPVLESHWPPERKMIEEGYQGVQFPMEELTPPAFKMELEWDLSQLVGYLNTWSAVKKYEAINGSNPVELLYEKLANYWGNPDKKLTSQWPLTLRIWRKR